MPTIGTFTQLLPKGFKTARYRSTDATVFAAIEGNGRTRIGDEVFEWGPRDLFVVPSWRWVTHTRPIRMRCCSRFRIGRCNRSLICSGKIAATREEGLEFRRVGKGALATCPPSLLTGLNGGQVARAPLPTLQGYCVRRVDRRHRQCSNFASNTLIAFPTASPNSDSITTPANSWSVCMRLPACNTKAPMPY